MRVFAARGGAPFHHAGVYKSAQPLSQKRTRDAGKTTLEVVEMRNIGKQFTDNEHCPTIREKLRRSGDRTILAVKMHGTPYFALGRPAVRFLN
jgi:hypothetical protein